jgi:hypothetical protein
VLQSDANRVLGVWSRGTAGATSSPDVLMTWTGKLGSGVHMRMHTRAHAQTRACWLRGRMLTAHADAVTCRTMELLRRLAGMPGPQLVDSSGRWALDNRREFGSASAAASASAPSLPSQAGRGDAGHGRRASGRDALVRLS